MRQRLIRAYRQVVALGCGLVAALAIWSSEGEIELIDGFVYDIAVTLRGALDRRAEPPPPVAIIALDGRSLDSQELTTTPRVFMAPQWSGMLDAVFDAGAGAVAFDIIFAYSASSFSRDYDKPFLSALVQHGDKVVLGRSARTPMIDPIAAVLDEESIGFVELKHDADGVYRRVSRHREVASHTPGAPPEKVNGLAAALLERAGLGPMPEGVLLAPRRHLEYMPTYSLIDVLRCAKTDPQVLARAFKDKLIFVGTTLPEEDRKTTPDRFMTPPPVREFPNEPGVCRLEHQGASDPTNDTVPGVYVHAAAAAAVVQNRVPVVIGIGVRGLFAGLLAAATAYLAVRVRPWVGAVAGTAAVPLLILLAAALLAQGWVLPVAAPFVGMAASALFAYAVRYLVEERRRRRVENAFGHYLAPSLVARLSADKDDLHLGGETREITVMFADLSGFTALSEKISAAELMAVTNRYLGFIVDCVEAEGGYVDKFIGDAVMGIWGAPISDPNHAMKAVRAARATVERIEAEWRETTARGEHGFTVKIGINSGPAVVGNVGTEKRKNYTAVGETVNISSRLESLPKDYGCTVVVGENTARLAAHAFVFLELDLIRVKGKQLPIAVFEPLIEGAEPAEALKERMGTYGQGLKLYRAGKFAAARTVWRTIEPGPCASAAAAMIERCQHYIDNGAPVPWDGVWVRTSK